MKKAHEITKKARTVWFFCLVTVFLLAGALWPLAAAAAETPAAGEDPPRAQEEQPRLLGYQKVLYQTMDDVFRVLESIRMDRSLTIEEQKQKAMEFLRNYRFGKEKKDYCWVTDLQGKMLLEPYLPELEGKDLSDFRDANDEQIFFDAITKCITVRQGFTNFLWPMYENRIPTPKIAYVRAFEAWGWIVGAGEYLKTIEAYEEPDQPEFYSPVEDIEDRNPVSPV